MTTLRLRIGNVPRLPTFPLGDEELGAELWRELSARLRKGAPRPTLFAFWPDRVQLVDMVPFIEAGADVHRAVSSFASQPDVEAIATSAVMMHRRKGSVTGRSALVFVEWSDGRWWSCTRPLERGGSPVADASDEIERAVDGAAKPVGLGSWFSRARFEGLRVRLEPQGADAIN